MVFHGDGEKEGGKNTARAGTSYIIYTDSGHMMLAGAAVLEIIGFFMINRIVAIKV